MTGTLSTYGAGTYGSDTFGGVPAVTPPDGEPRWCVVVGQADGTWVDVSCDVRQLELHAGRSSYVEAFTAATATVVLANESGVYSTFPDDSVWRQPDGYVTGVALRVGSLWAPPAGAADPMLVWHFTGTTDAVNDSWPDFVDVQAKVTATDGFKALSRHKGDPGRPVVGAGELSGARINRLAGDAAWAGPRAIDAGTVALQGSAMAANTLDEMRAVGEAEWGWLFVAGDGTLTFRQKDAADTDPRMTAVQYIFTDSHALAGACYGDATVIGADDDSIVNVATVQPPGHASSSYSDAASVAHFGPRTWSRTDLLIANDIDAASLTQLVVEYYRSDDRRIDAVTIDAANRSDAWPAAHGCRINDRVRFVRTQPGGWQIDAELLVQGRTDRMTAAGVDNRLGDWTVTLATASAASVTALGHWDEATWDDGVWGV